MKNMMKRMAAAALALLMCLSMLPSSDWMTQAQAETIWGVVTAEDVKVRKYASTGKDYWFEVDTGYTCAVNGTVVSEGVTWYHVNATHPEQGGTRTYVGYIHGNYFRLLTATESAELEQKLSETTGNLPAMANTIGEVVTSGVNFRETPGGNVFFKLDGGTQVEVLTIPTKINDQNWYQVRYNGFLGYIQAPYLRVISGGAASNVTAAPTTMQVKLILSSANLRLAPDGTIGAQWENPGETLDVIGSVESSGGYQWYPVRYNGSVYYVRSDCVQLIMPSAATAVPTATPAPQRMLYVKLILDSANLRLTPGGTVAAQWETPGEMLLVTGTAITKGDYTWYPVVYNGNAYYVRNDCVQLIDSSTVVAPTAKPVGDTYIMLMLSSANLRLTPDGTIAAQWEKTGEVVQVVGEEIAKGNYLWYPIMMDGNVYYVRNDCVQVVTADGFPVVPGGSTPVVTAPPAYIGYVVTVLDKVNLRLQPAGMVIQEVAIGRVLPMLKEPVVSDGYTWYYVQDGNVKGYLRGDCVQAANADGTPITTQPPTGGTGVTSSFGYVRLVEDKVNLRRTIAGESLMQLPMGTVLALTGNSTKSGNYVWYPVMHGTTQGYVRGDCAVPCRQDGSAIESTPTATPGVTVSPYGYVMMTVDSVNVRDKAAGQTLGTVGINTVWPMTGEAVTKSGYTWYPINAGSLKGYVRGDCCFKLSATQQESYLAGNGVPYEPEQEKPAEVKYVQTVLDKVNLREAATKDAKALYNVSIGLVMAYNDVKTVGGSVWYRVVYDNNNVWVLGSCVKVMTAQEYQNYINSNPATTPQPEVFKGYVVTTVDGVNLRAKANGSKILGRISEGTIMIFVDEPTIIDNVRWYPVKHETLGYGFVHGEYVQECNADGSATKPPVIGGDEGKEEAEYTTLRLGSTGTAVRALVAELKEQGYYTGAITSSYTSSVEQAIRAFQKAKGLTVDGIAGAETQHKLFDTVPIGSGAGNLTMTLYPAEKIDWYTGGIQELWRKGENYKIYDVYTGIVWWAHRWSGGAHADIEPLTAADTARLCKMYGVNDAQEIYDKNMWERRPSLVTIDGHTYACSLDGMPHNPDGDTIPNNNMTGQICLHFTNSRGHESGVVSDTHQEAIEYAWNNCPAGKK